MCLLLTLGPQYRLRVPNISTPSSGHTIESFLRNKTESIWNITSGEMFSYFWKFGVLEVQANISPNVPTFWLPGSKHLERRPQYSALWRNLQNFLGKVLVLCLGWGIMKWNTLSSQKPRCPATKTEKPLWVVQTRPFLRYFVWDTVSIGMRVHFSLWDCSEDAYWVNTPPPPPVFCCGAVLQGLTMISLACQFHCHLSRLQTSTIDWDNYDCMLNIGYLWGSNPKTTEG